MITFSVVRFFDGPGASDITDKRRLRCNQCSLVDKYQDCKSCPAMGLGPRSVLFARALTQTHLIATVYAVMFCVMKQTRKIPGTQIVPMGRTVDWLSITVGTQYCFAVGTHFDDFQTMQARAHNAARRRGLKARTLRDTENGLLMVEFQRPKRQRSRKRAV